ncbi:MAG: energy-coupling factor ABC transporter ATP-binding protein [Synergistaceae bacterium]|jgi:cobalt/nickel transport system ATP-binding protein|nr:energy-coupling factor ABC transporter ATP-binding protein [Synergistaceae bacterium]
MLTVKGLTVKYDASDAVCALESVDFSVESGEKIALIGANGAGKSTLLSAAVGILPPHSGQIVFDGVAVGKETLRDLRLKVGMVFQNPDDQLFMPTVYEDIAFGPRNLGLAEEEIETRMEGILARLGASYLKERMTHKLSGGEKRLAALAGVLIMEPSVLLMDEPSSFLDPRARRRLMEILATLPQAMLIATHDLDLALDLCQRAVLLKEGRIEADAPVEEVLSDASLLERCGLELPLSAKPPRARTISVK